MTWLADAQTYLDGPARVWHLIVAAFVILLMIDAVHGSVRAIAKHLLEQDRNTDDE